MQSQDVKRLALIFAVQAEVEGMKAHNTVQPSDSPTLYIYADFFAKVEELRELAYKHDDQL